VTLTGRQFISVGFCGILSVLGASSHVEAQGHGHAYGHAHQGGVTSGSGSSSPLPASGSGIRDFGVWLDDASVAPPGGGWASLSVSYFRSDVFREIDVPVANAGVGVARGIQFGFSVPYYNMHEPGGATVHGVGDLYVHSKLQLRDPATNSAGFAILPIVEVLSADQPAGRHRVNWALPVSVELQRQGWRAYGSTGYFSRGSIFASGALERTLSSRAWVTGTISQSVSLHEAVVGLSRVRTDISGGASYLATSSVTVFASVGRTISSQDPDRARLLLSGGLSINVVPVAIPTRKASK
jgi:hypothetical protein